MFLKRALGSESAGAHRRWKKIRKYVQVALPGLHSRRGELCSDGVNMFHKALIEAADGVPACAHVAGPLEGHGEVEESRGVVVNTAELEGLLVRG